MVNLFNLEKKYADDMVAHARTEAPNECCGILAGKDERVIKLYRTTNTEHSPYRYKIDPVQMLAIYEENSKEQMEAPWGLSFPYSYRSISFCHRY
jgi:proteasome lid subunit RPN8/RPN11